MLNRKYQGTLDGEAVDTGIFKLSFCRSPIDGRCGVMSEVRNFDIGNAANEAEGRMAA